MTTLKKSAVMVIDPNERVAEEVRKKTREVNDKYCNYKYQVHDTEKTGN